MHLNAITIDHQCFPTQTVYPFNLTCLQQTQTLALGPITVFTGENGTGKSTLLKALCRRCRIHIWEGSYRTRFTVNPHEDNLHKTLALDWRAGSVPGSFFSPELFRNFSQLVDDWAKNNPALLKLYGGESLVTQSHGQSCMAYFKAMYKVRGLHFLDEPEAALSPTTQLELRDLLVRMSTSGRAQFVISTHSPILMSCPEAVLFSFDNGSIRRVDYRETEHYKVYSHFFKNR